MQAASAEMQTALRRCAASGIPISRGQVLEKSFVTLNRERSMSLE
jgi:hypothetical protein